MAEKQIQTRIIQKNSDLNSWLDSDFNLAADASGAARLKKGEIALAYVATSKVDADGQLKIAPTFLMKVGDGVNRFSDLEWLAAPASDVYAWAKATEINYENGMLTLKNGADDGSDLIFDLKNTFYSKDVIDALLATKVDIEHGTHVAWATQAPRMDGNATVGILDRVAREDHVHPVDTSRAPLKHAHGVEDLPAAMPPTPHNHDSDYYTIPQADARLRALETKINNKSDSSHNHNDLYVTSDIVDAKITTAVGSTLKYKGTVQTTAQLPTALNNSVGDVWIVKEACEASGNLPKVNAGDSVAWNGNGWDVLAGNVDLSGFYNKTEIDAMLLGKAAESHGIHVTWATEAPKINGNTTVGVIDRVAREDHVHPVDTSRAPLIHTHTAKDLPATMPPSAHNHDDTYYTKAQAAAAFTNKPAFSKVKVGTTILTADVVDDVVELTAGSNVTLTPDATNTKLTINSKDTDTHWTTTLHVGAETVKANAEVENPYIKLFDDTTLRSSLQLKGDIVRSDGIIKVSSNTNGDITIEAFPEEHTYVLDGGLASDHF